MNIFDFRLRTGPAGPGFQRTKTTSDGKILAGALIWRDDDYLGRRNPGRGRRNPLPIAKKMDSWDSGRGRTNPLPIAKNGVPEAPGEAQT